MPIKQVEEKEELSKSTPKPSRSANASDIVTNSLKTALKSEKEEVRRITNIPSILKVTPNDNDNASGNKRDFPETVASTSKQNMSQVKQPKLEETVENMAVDEMDEEEIKFVSL